MERKQITSDYFDWLALIQHVVGDQTTVELEQDNVPLVRITPLKKAVLLSELNGSLADLPALGDDVEPLAEDIRQSLGELPMERDSWES